MVNDPLLFLQPFDVKLWVALLGAVFAAAVIQKLISLYTPYGDRRAALPVSCTCALQQAAFLQSVVSNRTLLLCVLLSLEPKHVDFAWLILCVR